MLFLIAVIGFTGSVNAGVPARFSFSDGTFKISQFTDLHWTSEQNDQKTRATIKSILENERPALAVLTGDVVTGDDAVECWKGVIRVFEESATPFIVTLGNHDGEVLSKDSIFQLLLASPWYAGVRGPLSVHGYGNCIIPVYDSNSHQKIQALLYFIDSNDYTANSINGYYDWVRFDQINWYREQSTKFKKQNAGVALPALAFLHIPVPEFNELIHSTNFFGTNGEGQSSSAKVNSGLFSSLVEMNDVMGVFSGHDHDNDFIGNHQGIALAYGRVTGANAYGSLQRGSRNVKLFEGERRFDTWISTTDGKAKFYYYPSAITSDDETTMEYLQAKNVSPKKKGVAFSYYEGKFKHTTDIKAATALKDGIKSTITIQDSEGKDHFAYRFRSLINIPERGVYRFYTYSDDGSKLMIDEKVVVDNDGGHSPRRVDGKIAREKGFHELELLYFEDYMGEVLEVGYQSRLLPESKIQAESLYCPDIF